jgi:hypothetical protein
MEIIEMEKGKCFSAVNRGQRKKSDFYETPYSMTEQLWESEDFNRTEAHDPACGNGAIGKVLKHYFFDFFQNDIKYGEDFLKSNVIQATNIITNPPFSLAHEFIQKAKSIFTDKIAFLLPLSYLHGQKRFEDKIFSELKCIHVFTRYPMLGEPLREDGKYHTGMIAYAWYIWVKGWKKEPVIRWIDNQKYVIGKNDI